MAKLKEVRVSFEAKPGVENSIDEFKTLIAPHLVNSNFEFGGNIAMNALEKVYGKLEPVYQIIARDNLSETNLMGFFRVPGYVMHIYEKRENQNSQRVLKLEYLGT